MSSPRVNFICSFVVCQNEYSFFLQLRNFRLTETSSMESGRIQCYFQKKLSHSEVLELLSKEMPSQQNENEKLIFTEGAAPQPLLANPSNSASTSAINSTTSKHDYEILKLNYQKLKNEHEMLKNNSVSRHDFDALKMEFEAFKHRTEQKFLQIHHAVRRQDSVEATDDIGSNTVFFEAAKLRPTFIMPIAFYDQPMKKVDLVEVFKRSPKCKDGITTTKEISDLYKDVICKVSIFREGAKRIQEIRRRGARNLF